MQARDFTHSAFLYGSDATYTSTLTAFITEGLAQGEAVAVAADARQTALLRDSLAGAADDVRFLAAEQWYVRPGNAIAGWIQLLKAAAADGRGIRLIGHTPLGAASPAWIRYESALTRSLGALPGHLLCPYDRATVPADVLRTHPVLHDGGWQDNSGYQEPEQFLVEVPETPYPVTGTPVITVPVLDTVADLRDLVRRRATAEDWLTAERVESLILALSEIATNAIRHGGDKRELVVWLTGEAVVCEVTDDGAAVPGPLAAYLPPQPGVIGGMGLWLVQQVCDALSVRARDGLTQARFALLRNLT